MNKLVLLFNGLNVGGQIVSARLPGGVLLVIAAVLMPGGAGEASQSRASAASTLTEEALDFGQPRAASIIGALTSAPFQTVGSQVGQRAGPSGAERLVSEFSEAHSGPAGPSDEQRLASLFAPTARVITVQRPFGRPAAAQVRAPAEYIRESREYWKATGFDERPTKQVVEHYSNLAHVLCALDPTPRGESSPYFRGVVQLSVAVGRIAVVDSDGVLDRRATG